jgi:phosphohistidine phosphatase
MHEPKQLFVLRHAKSSWDDSGLEDHERPLGPRGQRAVRLLGEQLRKNDIHPVQVLCSSSRRTRETLDGVDPDGERIIENELYDASCDEVIERLKRVPDDTASVMLIGHNPAMQMLVLRLTGANGNGIRTVDGDLAEVQRKFPTGALASLVLECSWSELSPGCAKLVDYIRPRALH